MYGYKSINKGVYNASNTPANNMRFNGKYLNVEVDGYRQLNVGGRSLISRSVDTTNIPMRSGAWFNYIQDDMRELTIQFQLVGKNTRELRDKYAKLNALLRSKDPVPIVFDDERDWTYYGIYTEGNADIESATSIVNTFKIICPSPFKFKTKQIVTNGRIGTLESEFVYPTRMVLTITKNTRELTVTNGIDSFKFQGDYAIGNKIIITWGDELKVTKNGENILHELAQFTNVDFFELRSNMTVSSPQATINEIEWRDERL